MIDSNLIKISVLIIAAALLVVGYFVFWGGSGADDDDKLAEAIRYLRDAKAIKITRLNFDNDTKKVTSHILLNSQSSEDVGNFIDVLQEQLAVNNVKTSIKHMEVFTADFKVELSCRKYALIEFVFYEDNNAACLRNEDNFFFAEFNPDSAEVMKGYFNQLN